MTDALDDELRAIQGPEPAPEDERTQAVLALLAEGEALRRERGLTTFEGYIAERREDLAAYLTDCDPGDEA